VDPYLNGENMVNDSKHYVAPQHFLGDGWAIFAKWPEGPKMAKSADSTKVTSKTWKYLTKAYMYSNSQ